ncbi:MAG: nuclear transport factor 2 family protein [Burkholderiales bacterium]
MGTAALAAPSAEDERDHEELRGLLKLFTEAFNTRKIEPLIPYLHRDFSVTMVNQDVVTTPKELGAYLDKQFSGPDAPLKDVQIKPDTDIPTVFLEGRFGINRGGSTDTYTLKDGRVFVLNTRWTGTGIKEEGKWKVLNAHIGLNIIDNPILDAMEKLKWIWVAAAGASGLLVGTLGTLWLRRRRA